MINKTFNSNSFNLIMMFNNDGKKLLSPFLKQSWQLGNINHAYMLIIMFGSKRD